MNALVQAPPHYVERVDAVVADPGRGGVPEKVPAVVETVHGKSAIRGWSKIKVPIHAFRNRCRSQCCARKRGDAFDDGSAHGSS